MSHSPLVAKSTTMEHSNGHQAAATTATTSNGSADAEDEPQEDERYEAKVKHWKESPFAVGLVNIRWEDDTVSCTKGRDATPNPDDGHLCLSAYCCGWLGADRVGNLAVLAQTTEEYDELVPQDSGGEGQATTTDATTTTTIRRATRPKLLWVVGPYWPVNLFITYPLIIGISLWTALTRLGNQSIAVIIVWICCTFTLIFSLAMVACRDPGVLYRHRTRPPRADSWRWNDQARTFRPPKARYDPECAVVIEGFDHTCPWTGTAIGTRNFFWFKVFVFMVPVCIGFNVVLHIFL